MRIRSLSLGATLLGCTLVLGPALSSAAAAEATSSTGVVKVSTVPGGPGSAEDRREFRRGFRDGYRDGMWDAEAECEMRSLLAAGSSGQSDYERGYAAGYSRGFDFGFEKFCDEDYDD